MVAELELENKKLKEEAAKGGNPYTQPQFTQSFNAGSSSSHGSRGSQNLQNLKQDKDWMSFKNQPLERPQTSSGMTQQVKDLQEELKSERRDKKKLLDQIEDLNREL